jgi:hypothetical protein
MVVYRAADGSVKWRNDQLEYSGPCILYHDTIITNANSYKPSAGAFNLLDGTPVTITNPLTGQQQPWTIQRAYGCNSIIASEHLLTFRSGAAGFYDLNSFSGTGNLGGFRTGCTANLVAADGVLNAPDYTRTCSCPYQNQTSLALIHIPDMDMWTVSHAAGPWQPGQQIERIGINFGAPGDRRADSGTLWLEYPQVGGEPVPVEITVQGPARYYRRHSSTMPQATAPWVVASGVQGAVSIRIPVQAATAEETPVGEPRPHTVRLYFGAPQEAETGQHVFDVLLQGETVLRQFDVLEQTPGRGRSQVKQFRDIPIADQLEISFRVHQGQSVLSGVEIRREDEASASK